jgi:hypothetical protein
VDIATAPARGVIMSMLAGLLWGRRRKHAQIRSDPAGASTADIGWAWDRSSRQLARFQSPAVRESLVRERQAYLDELDRRDSMGLARWGRNAIAGWAVRPEVFIHRNAVGIVDEFLASLRE